MLEKSTRQLKTTPSSKDEAGIPPRLARSLLAHLEDNGYSAERLCLGLGFTYGDLTNYNFLISYQQTRSLITRALDLTKNPALGLQVGIRQTPVSLGLAGLALLTCENLYESILFGMQYQRELGAVMYCEFINLGSDCYIEVSPYYDDVEINGFLAEEAMGLIASISRYIVGEHFKLSKIEFTARNHKSREAFIKYFRCPVVFGAEKNRIIVSSKVLSSKIPGYDKASSLVVRGILTRMMKIPAQETDLLVTLKNKVHTRKGKRTSQSELAKTINMSDRTLRRKLGDQNRKYRDIRSEALQEMAEKLLAETTRTIREIAEELGYSETKNFRRAFLKWTGTTPSGFRNKKTGD